jgi:glutamate-ammonia-ligase adenylyltransferase
VGVPWGKIKPMFDIKHDEGGMIDIEFIVQAKVLSHAHQFADLTCIGAIISVLSTA